MSAREEVEAIRREQQAMETARRTRENAATEATGILARLHRFGRDDPDVRALLTVPEIKVLGAAEATLSAIAERLSQ